MRRGLLLLSLAASIVISGQISSVRATPSSGFVGQTLATSTFDELNLSLHTIPADLWQLRLKTQGQSDLCVQSNTWQPHGSTGWHTHPGPSLVIITTGTVTVYDGDDPSCSPHVFSALPGYPHNFVDAGGGHVHLVRNEDASLVAAGYAVQFIPQGGTRRIDAPAPDSCPLSVR